ncbi:glycosyltransferase [Chitinophaga barathri]|uniref:Glycosyltransferase n=1 Tax=Chitinophaga barathri TaxID=1647451 RepID=A0A3N4M9M2_9BACT|nr:glycosyltransferase [Chitinophaga barathri]RPD40434.1 glycosyltransferase [Chitinophaga barathri]
MRIAVNAHPLMQDSAANTGNVPTELMNRLCRLHPDAEFVFITDRPWAPVPALPPNCEVAVLKPFAGGKIGQYLWRRYQWNRLLKKYRIDRLLCIDDVLPFPQEVQAHLLLIRKASLPDRPPTSENIRRFRSISVFSEFMKEQIGGRYGGLEQKFNMLSPGVSEIFIALNWEEREQVKHEFAGGMEYFIAVGAIHPDNNIIPLLKAFSMLKKRLRSGIKLVLAGDLTPEGEDIAEALQTYKFREDVIWMQEAGEEDLARLIGGAYALVHTAGADGLAVPVLQAQRCQVPGIVIFAGASTEAGGDAALNAVPGDVTDLSEKMSALYKDELLRSRLLDHIGRIPSWDDAAGQLGQIITA